jgi:hypothetical protein
MPPHQHCPEAAEDNELHYTMTTSVAHHHAATQESLSRAHTAAMTINSTFGVEGTVVSVPADGNCMESSVRILVKAEGEAFAHVEIPDGLFRQTLLRALDKYSMLDKLSSLERLCKPTASLSPDDLGGWLPEIGLNVLFVEVSADGTIAEARVVGPGDGHPLARTIIVVSSAFGGHAEPLVLPGALDLDAVKAVCGAVGVDLKFLLADTTTNNKNNNYSGNATASPPTLDRLATIITVRHILIYAQELRY